MRGLDLKVGESPIIVVDRLGKVYKMDSLETAALADVSFRINRGEFVAIMGPSGSGKSTLMHILGALDSPTSGCYLLDGRDIGRLTEDELAEIRNRKIGFIFQSYNLLPRTTALNNVILPMKYAGLPKKEREERARQCLEMVGLGDRLDHTAAALSGGQQQRVAIARALVLSPAILLADEPTGNIASAQAEEIMNIFQNLNDSGHTIVMITHEADIAQHAGRIIHLRDGRISDDRRDHEQRKVNARS